MKETTSKEGVNMISKKRRRFTAIITILFLFFNLLNIATFKESAGEEVHPVTQTPELNPQPGLDFQQIQPSQNDPPDKITSLNNIKIDPLQKNSDKLLNLINNRSGNKYILPEGVIGEYTKKRTENSKLFLKDNGKLVHVISASSLHYQDANGEWKNIDNNLKATSESNFSFQNSANQFNAFFSNETRKGNFIRFKKDNRWLDFEPIGANKANSITSGNKIIYSNVYNDVDFLYTVENDSLKEDIILHSYQGKSSFSFKLGLKNVTYNMEKDGSIVFFDASTGQQVWAVEKPFMMDSNGIRSEEVNLSISNDKNGLVLTVTANQNWLQDENRAYPITIDPTIFISSGIDDTYIVGDTANIQNTWNFSNKQELIVGMWGPNVINNTHIDKEWYKTFLNFHLTNRTYGPENLISAKVRLYKINSDYSGNPTGDLIPYLDWVMGPWTEKGITSANKPILNTTSLIAPKIEGNFFIYDVSNIVRSYKETPMTEYGFYLSTFNQVNRGRTLFASERSGSFPPQLEFEFENQYYAGYNADVPTVMIAGEDIKIPVNVTNSGVASWSSTGTNAISLSYYWEELNNSTKIQGIKTPLPHDLSPGDAVTVMADVQAPPTSGKYKLCFDMWIGNESFNETYIVPTADVNVSVVSNFSGLGIEKFWQYQRDSYGNRINLSNGNLVLQKEIFNLAGRLPISAKLTYNSRSTFNGMFGYGWNSELERTLVEDSTSNVRAVTYIDEDGTEHVFTKNADGYFSAPQGIYYYLEKVPINETTYSYKLTDLQNGTVYNYAKHGSFYKVSSIEAKNNKIVYTYTSDKLTSIKIENDDTLREIKLTYDANNRVSTIEIPGGNDTKVTTKFTVDGSGNLIQIDEASNTANIRTTKYGYDTNHHMTLVTYPNGNHAKYEYTNNQVTRVGGSNLLRNAGFDYPDNPLANWTPQTTEGATIIQDSNAFSGLYALKMDKQGTGSVVQITSDSYAVTPSNNYVLSFTGKVASMNTDSGKKGVLLKGYDSSGLLVLYQYIVSVKPCTHGIIDCNLIK